MARTAEELITKMTADATGFLSGVSKADKSVKNFEKTNATAGKKISTIWKAVIASAIVVAGVKIAKAAIKIGKDLALLGDKSLSLKKSFEGLAKSAGASSAKLLADMKKATKGTIAEIDLLSTANKMMLLGLDTSMFDEVMEVARRTAKATGQDINYMIESLSMGLGRQSKMILDNLGIVFDTATAYEWYAETLGKTASQLTEVEKKLGFQTYAMKIASENVEKLGKDTLTLTEIGGIFSATWSNLKALIGEKIVGALNDAAEAFGGWENILSNFKDWVENFLIKKIISAFDWVTKFIKTLKDEDWSEIRIAIETLAAAFVAVDVGAFGAEESATSFSENLKSSISGAVTLVITLKLLFLEFILWLERSWFGKLVRWVASWQAFIEPTKANKKAFEEFTASMDKGIKETQAEIERTKKLLKDMGEAIKSIPGEKKTKFVMEYEYRGYIPGRRGGEPEFFQFGGIVPKTQAIMAHGGEAVLTTEMQRNLIALLRQPRRNYYTYSTPITVYASVREEADVRRIAEQLEDIRTSSARAGGIR